MQPRRSRIIVPFCVTLALNLFAATPTLAKPGNGNGNGPGGGGGGPDSGPPPYLSFVADRTDVTVGDAVTLSWASTNTRHCFASGDWSGKLDSDGFYTTPPLESSKTYNLECKEGGNAVAASVSVQVSSPSGTAPLPSRDPEPAPAPAPSVSLAAADALVLQGDSTSLTWSSTDADGCTASGGWSGSKPPDGSTAVGPLEQATTYSLTCSGAGGSATRSVTVDVEVPPTPTLTLQAAAATVTSGSGTSLSWTASDVDSCSASDGWSGSKPASGSEAVGPLTTATRFTLSCTGPGGMIADSVTVNVDDPPAPSVSLQAAQAMVAEGGNTTLSWSASNADSCMASGGWSAAKPVSGSESVGPLSTATTYSLTCSGAGGSATGSVTVDVEPATAPTLNLQAADSLVASGGTTTLTWSSSDADSCTASDGWSGSRPVSGSESAGPLSAATTFTLSCTGPGGTIADSVTVAVEDPPEPTVSLQAADTVVNEGASTTLTWSSTDADSCTASGGWSGARATSGSESTAALAAQTTYSLSCSGPGGSAMSMISVSVNGTVTLEWQAPSQNVDGSALTDLWGFRIYYGVTSGSYTDSMEIPSASATSQALTLASGEYYFAMTAVDEQGNESAFSNEVLKLVD